MTSSEPKITYVNALVLEILDFGDGTYDVNEVEQPQVFQSVTADSGIVTLDYFVEAPGLLKAGPHLIDVSGTANSHDFHAKAEIKVLGVLLKSFDGQLDKKGIDVNVNLPKNLAKGKISITLNNNDIVLTWLLTLKVGGTLKGSHVLATLHPDTTDNTDHSNTNTNANTSTDTTGTTTA